MISRKTDRGLKKIEKDKLPYTDFAKFISDCLVKSPEKAKEIINDNINKEMFNEDIQLALFERYYEVPPTIVEYIKKLLLSQPFFQRALGKFLSFESPEKDFLEKLVNKYGEEDSFWFNLGHFQHYKFSQERKEKKYFVS